MPFSAHSLSMLARGGAFTLWRYESADAPADLLGADYFLTAGGILRRGDLIVCADAAPTGRRTALLVVEANPARVSLEPLQSQGPSMLAALTDVELADPTPEEVLTFSDGRWSNRPAAGRAGDAHAALPGNPHGASAADVGAVAASDRGRPGGVATLDDDGRLSVQQLREVALAGLRDVLVDNPKLGDVLKFDGAAWRAQAEAGAAGDAFAASHGGAVGTTAHAPATATEAGFMAAADKEKLDRVEPGATADQTGAELVSAIDAELGSGDWRQDASGWGQFHGKSLGSALVEKAGAIDVDVASVVASLPQTRAISAPAGEDPSISLELPAAVDRRDFLLGFSATGAVTTTKVATAAALDTLARDLLSISPTLNPTVHEIDVSAYQHAVVPRGHGRLVPLGTYHSARYPSRDQSMQCMVFIGEKSGLLVQTKDPIGYITDWELLPQKKLRLTMHGPAREVSTTRTGNDWREGATLYRDWASKQYWATSQRPAEDISIIAVGSNPNLADQEQSAIKFVRAFAGKTTACWLTQWRRYPFDQYFPNYEPSNQANFASFLRLLHGMNCVPMPHINAVAWDLRTTEPSFSPSEMLLDKDGQYIRGTGNFVNLAFACPGCTQWRRRMIQARLGLVDSDGRMCQGIYLDVIGATKPHICFSLLHDHAPGDPLAWQLGTRRLLRDTPGIVMAEAVAEIYLDLVNLSLMHLYAERTDTVPLWDFVYGFMRRSVGWAIPKTADASQIEAEIVRAKSYGARCSGSPWMSSVIQEKIMQDTGGFLERLVHST